MFHNLHKVHKGYPISLYRYIVLRVPFPLFPIFFSFYIHHRLFISRSSLYFSVGTKLLSSSFFFCFPPRIYMPLYPPSFSTDLHFCIPCVLPPNIHIFHDSTFPHLNWVTFHSRYGSKAFCLLFCYKMFSCEY